MGSTMPAWLNVYDNERIQIVPSGSTLLELDAENSKISDAALAQATNLVWLSCSGNEKITTVAPFAQSLRHLFAQYGSFLDDAGLATATNLVTLNCSSNSKITSIGFCRNNLQELIVSGQDCGMKGDEIEKAPQLRKVVMYHNDTITQEHLKGFTRIHDSGFVRDEPLNQGL